MLQFLQKQAQERLFLTSSQFLIKCKQISHNFSFNQKQQDFDSDQDPHGAIILAPNKELCNQIYAWLLQVDKDQQLKVSRTGSISHISPHIENLVKKIYKKKE